MPPQNEVTNETYSSIVPEEIKPLIAHIDQLKSKLNVNKEARTDLWPTIQQKLRIDWTYNSNAIEGNTLTRGETHFFLTEGLTAEGKPFKDFVDAKNHSEAILLLYEIIKNERPISESLIKELNALLLQGLEWTPAMDPLGNPVRKKASTGEYKKQANHVLQPDGSIHYYVKPEQVQPQMQELVSWVETHGNNVHPIFIAAMAHYHMVRIHPFDDGNGRGARLLMNLILMKYGYPPAVVKNSERPKYIQALMNADQENMVPFIMFIAESLVSTMEIILEDLGNGK